MNKLVRNFCVTYNLLLYNVLNPFALKELGACYEILFI
jgi:hypothetical protein